MINNNNPKKLFYRLASKARQVRLSTKEKADIRARLEAFMQTEMASPTHFTRTTSPIAHDAALWLRIQNKTQRTFQSFRYQFHDLVTNPTKGKKKRLILTAIAAVIIFVTGGTSFAADKAIPGDSLYGIKIASEKMRSLLAVTPMQKARWATLQAIARLEETEKLAAQGKVSEKSRDEAIAHFKQQAGDVKKQVNLLRTTTNSVASDNLDTEFHASLENHQNILRQLSKDNPNDPALDNLSLYIHKEFFGDSTSTNN